MKIPKNTCHRRRLYVGSIFSFGSSGRCGSGLRIFHITIDFDYQFSNTTYILFVLPNHARFRNSSKLFTLSFISFRHKSKRFHFQNKASEQKNIAFGFQSCLFLRFRNSFAFIPTLSPISKSDVRNVSRSTFLFATCRSHNPSPRNLCRKPLSA